MAWLKITFVGWRRWRDASPGSRIPLRKVGATWGEHPSKMLALYGSQNFTRIARSRRFSIFFRSGVKPGTNAPGEPQMFSTSGAVGQDVGVTPPGPDQYGTLAAR